MLAGGMDISWRLEEPALWLASMIHRFEDFELDTDKAELRSKGAAIAVEPQVFALLQFLVETRDRVVSRDDLIAGVWGGRIVSDSAVASRIKSARQAVGDNGQAQRVIRTIHGRGVRFVADVSTSMPATIASQEPEPAAEPPPSSRPSIAILPFRLVGLAEPGFPVADALPHDLIIELSRLRWLFVIARGSSFRLRGAEATPEEVRAKLNARYCLAGVVEILGRNMTISVELSDTADKGVVWSERFSAPTDAVHEIRDRIVRAVVTALELQIPLNEARRAQLKSPETLDAWSAYHLGLHRMYRFNKADNAQATLLFEQAAAREPSFARAHAGLSFTHFQSAFLRYGDPAEGARLAQLHAERCLERDPMDPFGNFTMGRARWLQDDLEGSLAWLERANQLNPSYAQAKYARGWTEALLGSAEDSNTNIDAALSLSPLDPLLYGMLGVKSLSRIGRGETADAAGWAEKAANSPGAHALIDMIAVAAHGLNGNDARARDWAAVARSRSKHLSRHDFIRAFPFRDPAIRKLVTEMLERYGL